MENKKSIDQIAMTDGRYSPEAVSFVYEGLGYSVRKIANEEKYTEGSRHITGQELCYGLGDLAKEKWGLLAKTVLNKWGIFTTRDFGEIVYLMIENSWMSSQEGDQIEDFNNVFNFEDFFVKSFSFEMLEKK